MEVAMLLIIEQMLVNGWKTDYKVHLLEYKNNTVMQGEDYVKPRIKQEPFYPEELATGSQTYVQLHEKVFVKCVQSSDVDTKVGIWDSNVTSGDNKSDFKQPSTCLVTSKINGDGETEIKEIQFNQDGKTSGSQRLNLQQNEAYLMKDNVSSDVKTTVGIKEVALDPIAASSDKCDPEQPSTLDPVKILGPSAIKYDNALDLKVEHFNQDEISPDSHKLHIQQNETYFKDDNVSSDVDTKVVISQETWDPNGASSDIKCDPEQPLTIDPVPFFVTIKVTDEIDIKDEVWCCQETSTDSNNETGGSGSKKNRTSEDVPLFESSRPYTDLVLSCSAIQLQESKNTCSFSAKSKTSAQNCETERKFKSCGNMVQLLSQLEKHTLFPKEHKLRNCDKNCTHSLGLKEQLIHNYSTQYVCATCGKTFPKLGNFKPHLLVHDEKRKYRCKTCEKSFKRLCNLKSHLLVHGGKRQYKCQICEKTFKQLSNLKQHLVIHNDKRPYKCQVCEKAFKHLGNLKRHLLVHDNKRQFQCQVCGKSFKELGHLKQHLLVHDDEGQFKCKTCERSFKQFQGLKTHLLVHDDKRQYKCQVCEKSFKQLGSLKRHHLVHDN